MTVNDNEWQDWPEYECCGRAAMIVYRSGCFLNNCYEGTIETWPDAPMKCNESYRIFGEIIE